MMDTLSDILNGIYVSGTVFGHATFHGPWSVFTRGAEFAIFHAGLDGEACIVWNDGRRSQRLTAGSIAVVPRGSGHVMCANAEVEAEPIWIGDLFSDTDAAVSHADSGEGGATTRILCGTFHFDERVPNRLLDALPEVVCVRGDAQGGWVEKTLRWIDQEVASARPGADVVVTRLTDALFIQVVRACLEEANRAHTPWLAALADRNLSRALAAIHNDPGRDWTAASLARTAGLSRSAFYARFSELVGETPAQYLLCRRMDLAAHQLQSEQTSVAQVASTVGYRSESSFSKAFKRHFGVPPSSYREKTSRR
jgi:AraC-like DNA-binding protein